MKLAAPNCECFGILDQIAVAAGEHDPEWNEWVSPPEVSNSIEH